MPHTQIATPLAPAEPAPLLAVLPLRVAPHPVDSRVVILVGGFSGEEATVTEVTNGLHAVKTDALRHLRGYTAWQLEAVKE